MSPCSTVRSCERFMSRLTTASTFPRSIFKRPARPPTVKSPEVFARLSLEISLLIFEKLTQDDLCSLTLSCHAMEDYLGPVRDRWPQCSREDKQRFLVRYVRDYKEFLPCFACLSLHRPNQLQQPGVIKGHSALVDAISHGPNLPVLRAISGYYFDFMSLQMTMQAVRENRYARAVDDLRAVFVTDETHDRSWPRKELVSIEARAINESFYMRIQQWIYVVSRKDLQICKAKARGLPSQRHQLNTCIHWSPADPMWHWHCQGKDCIPERLSRDTESTEAVETCKKSGISTSKIYISVGRDGGQAFVLTHWVNLGTGESLDQRDQIWYPSRVSSLSFVNDLIFTGRRYSDEPSADISQAMYEAHGTFTWTALTRRNQSLIIDRIHSL